MLKKHFKKLFKGSAKTVFWVLKTHLKGDFKLLGTILMFLQENCPKKINFFCLLLSIVPVQKTFLVVLKKDLNKIRHIYVTVHPIEKLKTDSKSRLQILYFCIPWLKSLDASKVPKNRLKK